jgi:hypothetical protein
VLDVVPEVFDPVNDPVIDVLVRTNRRLVPRRRDR